MHHINAESTVQEVMNVLSKHHLECISIHLEFGHRTYTALVVDRGTSIATDGRSQNMWDALDSAIDMALLKRG
jgi:hypothetical protein